MHAAQPGCRACWAAEVHPCSCIAVSTHPYDEGLAICIVPSQVPAHQVSQVRGLANMLSGRCFWPIPSYQGLVFMPICIIVYLPISAMRCCKASSVKRISWMSP